MREKARRSSYQPRALPGCKTAAGGLQPPTRRRVGRNRPQPYAAPGKNRPRYDGARRGAVLPQNGDFHYRVEDFAFCSADELFDQFSKPGNSAPGAPAATPGTTPDVILTGGNPITQVVDPGARTITNITQEIGRAHV